VVCQPLEGKYRIAQIYDAVYSDSMTKTICDYMIESGLIAILIFTPLAKGATELWSISIVHFITLIMLVAWLLKMRSTGGFKIKKTSLDYPIIALLVIAAVSTIFSIDRTVSISVWPKIITYVFYDSK